MKKNLLITAGCALTVLCAMPALAAEAPGPYISGHLGVAMPPDATVTDSAAPGLSLNIDYDTGLALDLAMGYRFGAVRLEGEIAYQKNDFNDVTVNGVGSLNGTGVAYSGDTKTTSFLINGYYDFENDSAFTPYLAAGLGFARVKEGFALPDFGYGPMSWSDSDTVFAYQIGAGCEYAVTPTISIDARYRYFGTSDPSFGSTDAEFSSHNLMLGARFKF